MEHQLGRSPFMLHLLKATYGEVYPANPSLCLGVEHVMLLRELKG